MIGNYIGSRGELNFEDDVVELLTQVGWDKNVIKNPSHKDLEDNLRNIINENNIGKLGSSTLLTDGEFNQIMDIISLNSTTPVAANVLINGKQISIKSEIARSNYNIGNEMYLDIFDPVDTGCGKSRYQIVRQPIFKTSNKYNNRRGDIILLINGLPVIHIELKSSGISVDEGVNQIQKYMNESIYSKLYSLVQVFFVMTPEDCVYFANSYPSINPAFIFHWSDSKNNSINNWQELIKGPDQILSIPEAHQLVGYYTIANIEKNEQGIVNNINNGFLMAARSYQVHAIRNIMRRVKMHRWDTRMQLGGYVWGTTGCGKTLTSYKSGQLILDKNYVDKVVFVVDRVELSDQSYSEYNAFARDGEPIKKAKNTYDLFKLLRSKSRNDSMIITSIQKLSRINEDKSKYIKQSDIDAINNKRIVFIIDEAHRSQFGEMHEQIKNTFVNALFIGFTGTPIFEENDKAGGFTSKTVFGDCLAIYSIASGIRDKNVLGFAPTMVRTFKDSDLKDAVACSKANVKSRDDAKKDPNGKLKIYNKFYNLELIEIEKLLPLAQYDCDEHKKAVVEDILANWDRLSNDGRPIRFHALFATNSISDAVDYYRLLKNKGLKVTALFDPNVNTNRKATFDKEKALIEIVDDYNNMFNTGRVINRDADPSLKSFKRDVTDRLAHKGAYKNISDDDMIDIVIVVDQLLTGFDSKYINTLYLDKLLDTDNLIQAISRTNRVLDFEQKPFGIFRYYRFPRIMEKNIEKALELYCEGSKDSNVIVADIDENLKTANDLFDEIEKIFVTAKIQDFTSLPKSDVDRQKFKSLFRTLSQIINSMKFQGMNWKNDNDPYVLQLKVCDKWIDNQTRLFVVLSMRYGDLIPARKIGISGGRPAYDLIASLSEIEKDRIDADYLEKHFKLIVPKLVGNFDEIEKELVIAEFSKQLSALSSVHQEYAKMIINDISNGKLDVGDKTLHMLISEYQTNVENQKIIDFAKKYGLNYALLHNVYYTIGNHDIEISELCDTCDKAIVEAAFDCKWFVARAKLNKAIKDFIG